MLLGNPPVLLQPFYKLGLTCLDRRVLIVLVHDNSAFICLPELVNFYNIVFSVDQSKKFFLLVLLSYLAMLLAFGWFFIFNGTTLT